MMLSLEPGVPHVTAASEGLSVQAWPAFIEHLRWGGRVLGVRDTDENKTESITSGSLWEVNKQ